MSLGVNVLEIRCVLGESVRGVHVRFFCPVTLTIIFLSPHLNRWAPYLDLRDLTYITKFMSAICGTKHPWL